MVNGKKWDVARTLGLVALGSGALWMAARQRRRIELAGAVAVVTGGARGLGYAIAQELAAEGCKLALCGRDGDVVERAVEALRERGSEVVGCACDASDEAQVQEFFDQVLAYYGRVDLLINNAGQCFVGPATDLEAADVERALRHIFWVQFRPTMAVLPHMRRRGSGRIVSVTSIGGKLPTPHQAAYAAGKFAATGWAETLAIELRKEGIELSVVTPPPLQNGAPLHAHFNGQAEQEYLWFAHALSSPWTASPTRRAARAVVNAARYGDAERAVSFSSWLPSRLHGMAPNVMSRALSRLDRALPPPSPPGQQTPMQLGATVVARSRSLAASALTERVRENDRRFSPVRRPQLGAS
jgi:NAD(P)-dependent dehydrogenase (short-subunit alcohol dehydrogenase family)